MVVGFFDCIAVVIVAPATAAAVVFVVVVVVIFCLLIVGFCFFPTTGVSLSVGLISETAATTTTVVSLLVSLLSFVSWL